MIMSITSLKDYIMCDLYRYSGSKTKKQFFKCYRGIPGFKYTVWLRITDYLYTKNKYIPFFFTKRILRHYQFKFGIIIPYKTSIDKGFYIGHFTGIIVNSGAIIGKNVNISQGVSIGSSNRGNRKGNSIISDEVYIGPGAKIVGKVHIGSNVVIGANCVVTTDIPNDSVVVGIPGKVISTKGAEGYINRKI